MEGMQDKSAQTYSKTGIASAVIAGLSLCAVLTPILIIAVMAANGTLDAMEDNSTESVLLGCVLLVGGVGELLALAIGVFSLFSDKNKLFGYLGLAISGATVCCTLGLVILGTVLP